MRAAAAALALLVLTAHGAAAADTPDAAASTTTLPPAPTEKPRKSDPEIGRMDFEKFVREYLQYCMGFGEQAAARITTAGRPYLQYVAEACGGTSEPYLLGTFLLQKPRRGTA